MTIMTKFMFSLGAKTDVCEQKNLLFCFVSMLD